MIGHKILKNIKYLVLSSFYDGGLFFSLHAPLKTVNQKNSFTNLSLKESFLKLNLQIRLHFLKRTNHKGKIIISLILQID